MTQAQKNINALQDLHIDALSELAVLKNTTNPEKRKAAALRYAVANEKLTRMHTAAIGADHLFQLSNHLS